MDIYNFFHIPRTGGNYLLSGWQRCGSVRPIYFDGQFNGHGGVSPRREDVLAFLSDPAAIYVFHGHTSSDLPRLIPEFTVKHFTVLRDPVFRFLSETFWQFRFSPKAADIHFMTCLVDRWVSKFEDASQQTRLLARPFSEKLIYDAHQSPLDALAGPPEDELERAINNLKQYAYVGFFENIDKVYSDVAALIGLQPTAEPTNRNPSPSSFLQMSHEILKHRDLKARISELVKVDTQLYEWAKDYWNDRAKDGQPLTAVLGNSQTARLSRMEAELAATRVQAEEAVASLKAELDRTHAEAAQARDAADLEAGRLAREVEAATVSAAQSAEQIQELRQQILAARSMLLEAQQMARDLEGRLMRLYGSQSWRMTAPWRALGRYMRQLRGNGT